MRGGGVGLNDRAAGVQHFFLPRVQLVSQIVPMIKNFFKVAFRSLWRQKGYSFLNIAGLAIGMACSLLILLWIRDEEAVDNFHTKGDRLYSVYERQYYDGKIQSGHYTPGGLPDEMKKTLPQVEMSSGFDGGERMTFQVGDKILKEDGAFAGADFFRMFSYPLLEGRAESALAAPVSMAISRKMAVAFFGSPGAAIGKTIRNENQRDLKVMAVFEDPPSITAEKFDFVINWYAYLVDNNWARD